MNATLNIGLKTNKDARVPVHHAITVFPRFTFRDSRVADSATEQTLIARLEGITRDDVHVAAILLEQDCIAVLWDSGQGELIGPNAEAWGAFNPDYFLNL